jgi:hypothetical protein
MIPKSGYRFSEKIMLNEYRRTLSQPAAPVPRLLLMPQQGR